MPLVARATRASTRIVLKHLAPAADTSRACSRGRSSSTASRIPTDEITIHVVGKYTGYEDSYRVAERGAVSRRLRAIACSINIQWVEAEALEQEGGARLLDGARRHPGARRLRLARHARHDEGVRVRARRTASRSSASATASSGPRSSTRATSCGLDGADSTEVDETAPHKVIYKLRDLLGVDDLGGTMRLGRYACELAPDRSREQIYGTDLIHERHRHRFEFNCLYEPALTEHGMRISGPIARRQVRRDRGAARPSVVRRGAVPSRVPVAAAAAASAVCELRRRGEAAQGGTQAERRSACRRSWRAE